MWLGLGSQSEEEDENASGILYLFISAFALAVDVSFSSLPRDQFPMTTDHVIKTCTSCSALAHQDSEKRTTKHEIEHFTAVLAC